jgi:signal transduction histidine kinase
MQKTAAEFFSNLLVGILLTAGLYWCSQYSYLLFHSLAELFSIVVAAGIFMLAWNSRTILKNEYLLLLGIAYLFIGAQDLLHTLAYKGMGVFPGHGSNLPTQLWVSARYTESLSLLAAPFLFNRSFKPMQLLAVYAVATGLLLASIFAGIFPDCFVEGSGLTPFKKGSEYVISAVLLGSFAMLRVHRDRFEAGIYRLLASSIFLTVGSELAFTFYVSVYGLSNLVGHLFKLASFYLVYKAIIETGLKRPYQLLFRELQQNEQKLERTVQELERSNEDLEQFAYVASHDLQAPLRTVSSFVQLLSRRYKGKIDEKADEYISYAVEGAAHMQNLLHGLLEFSRVGSGKGSPDLIPLQRALDKAMRNLKSAIESSGADIQRGELPTVCADEMQMVQVFQNLIGNAIKFRGESPPVVQVSSEQRENEWLILVRDNGIGIDPKYADRIFFVFKRLHHKGEYAGTGIGLAICKKIVERQGGKLWVESAVGKGAAFYFSIPAKGEDHERHGIPCG